MTTGKTRLIHYRLIAGLSLAMIFFAHDMQDVIVPNLLLAVFGLWMILFPRPRVPMLFLVLAFVVQVVVHFDAYRTFLISPPFSPFDPGSLLLAGGMLIFLGCQYRMIAIVWHVGPPDPRFPMRKPRDADGRPIAPLSRPESAIAAEEFARFLAVATGCVFAGQWIWAWLSDDWTVLDFTPRFARLVFLVWLGVIGLFVAAGIVGYWRSSRGDGDRARLYLQEIAWLEARREYARIGRWIAWGKRKWRNRKAG